MAINQMVEPQIYLAEFDYPIAIVAGVVMLLGIGILYRVVGIKWAITIMSVKIIIALLYFVVFADGGWFVGGDDYAYFSRAADLNNLEAGLWDIWATPSMRYYLGEQHSIALTIILNYLAVNLFGAHYYAPSVFKHPSFDSISAIFRWYIKGIK